mmetsp:Transcript_8193/g.12228  ORF Transcript_8193/g.12228 Transcript_8193/m.12228 type:complete len:176 (-) Transcript_8193:109-636(-)
MDLNRKIDASNYGDNDLPLYPARTLICHVALKGFQLGSVVSVCIIAPAVSMYRRQPISTTFRSIIPIASLMGGSLSLASLFAKYNKGDLNSNDAVDDRAYRIYRNEGQNKVDKYSFIGAIAGAAASIVVPSTSISLLLASASTGMATGVLIYAGEKAANHFNEKFFPPAVDRKDL